MRALFLAAGVVLLVGGSMATGAAAAPLAHTYSIVARDPATGDFGVAVQSHWLQVGAVVPWARAGVGAVATQSFVRVDYGPRGLELMAAGSTARQALDRLVEEDPERDVRQVAMVDAAGRVATWTGAKCIPAAGHASGKGYSVQANLMERPTVWGAMAVAYERAEGSFAERLLAALDAAQAEGGDIRGRQSAALLIVRAESTGHDWEGALIDLRVDDHPEPLVELRRLLTLHRAYEETDLGDEASAAGDLDGAIEHYRRGAELAPEIPELRYWQAVTLYSEGHAEVALPIFRRVFAEEQRWVELTRRLPAVGLLPQAGLEEILAEAPGGTEGRAAGIEVAGRLTGEGVECPALRSEDGKLYTLVGKPEGFAMGERVIVRGEPVAFSFCMQGITLRVESMESH
jgi:uncharacterized Ntn-hydrolase superfamily protein